ncbi:pectin lyase-like protein [Corynespora cassiicola Philippines]|uniref:Pectin lyase-like protein n=1 Tax=Corynespora cassiicola Philippines TaxID=1448308 RepID=A0A2T2NIW4_CORCC|nr:pectin lyase-like protein [Corynespora cassiicola Philippines]
MMQLYKALRLTHIIAGLATAGHASSTTSTLPKREPCIVPANGFEAIDDSPAINSALQTCGDGGTIILPSSSTYSIHTPINFSPCKNCDVQIEGTLLVAPGNWKYWEAQPSVLVLSGVTGARIRSLTGSGLIDGNAVDWYTNRWDSGFLTTRTLIDITDGSSAISIDNLAIRNPMQRFVRAQRHSRDLSFSRLRLTAEQQWGRYPRNEVDVAGIELGETTHVSIADSSIEFHARASHAGTVGVCVPLDIGTHDVHVRNLTCKGAWSGVVVALNSMGTIAPTAAQLADTVSNVHVSGLVFEGDTATGFQSYGHNSTMRNITWDGVTVLAGAPANANLCFLKLHSCTPCPPQCWRSLAASVTDVWFKRFRGNVGETPGEGYIFGWPLQNMKPEYHFEDWKNTTAV